MNMASIHKRQETWWVKFRFAGKQIFRSLKTDKEREAQRLKFQIERTITDIEQGRITLPADVDLWQFILSDGKLAFKPTLPVNPPSLADLKAAYFGGDAGS
jgi:hypothetical protein